MTNTTRWYSTRERVKRAVGLKGTAYNPAIDEAITSASEDLETLLGRRLIPYLATKVYDARQSAKDRFPNPTPEYSYCLTLDEDLLSVTSLTKDNDQAVVISSDDYFLEPANQGPPYREIALDLSTLAYFSYFNTPQQALRVTGEWGYSNETRPAGALAAAVADTTGTSIDVTDASKVEVGDTLLAGTEQLFVSERSPIDTTADLAADLDQAESAVLVTLSDGTKVKQGEVILIGSEKILVESVTGDLAQVQRAVDGSYLAAHTTGDSVYVYRRLTVTRGENGTTAATHLINAALSKYVVPQRCADLCTADAIAHIKQNESGWTGQISGGDGGVRLAMLDLRTFRKDVEREFRWYPV